MRTWKIPDRPHVPKKYKEERRAGVILVCENNVMIVRTYNTHWGFPKGAIRAGECEEGAASRELYEEAGIRIHPSTIKRTASKLHVSGGVLFVIVIAKKLEPNVEIVRSIAPNDSSGVGWVNIECIGRNSNLICSNYLRHFINDVAKKGINGWKSKYAKND